ncbi:outer membrane protein assembly factor BamB family protein, partial [Vibrio parahaemolyticus]
MLFVAGAGGRVTALDATTGSIRWYDRLGSALASPPIVSDNILYY